MLNEPRNCARKRHPSFDFINGNCINLMTGQTLLNIDREGLSLSYLKQMKYFLSAAKNKEQPMNSLEESLRIIKPIL